MSYLLRVSARSVHITSDVAQEYPAASPALECRHILTLTGADHRALPVDDQTADLAISGWSIVYTVVGYEETWRHELRKALTEMKRVLRPGGTIIILETLGTGYETPTPPDDLTAYYAFLEDEEGFSSTWIRTDYLFESMEEAEGVITFFFGEEIVEKLIEDPLGHHVILPECTGIWWLNV